MKPPGYERGLAWFAAPMLVAAALLVAVPAVLTLALAFTEYDGLSAPRWVGAANFGRLARDPLFRTALWNSLIFVALAVPLRLAGSAGLALLYAKRRRGVGAMRAAAYLPTVVPDISYALLWLWVFNPLYGPFALVLQAFGVDAPAMLLHPWGARVAIVVMSLFQIGEGFIVALAARHDIPQELYELSALEGGGPWWTFRKVTLPLLAPTLILLAARDIVFSFQANLVPALVLTNGGPRYATTFLPLYTYLNAFEFLRLGYASAMTLAMYVLTAGMVALQVLVVRRWRSAWAA